MNIQDAAYRTVHHFPGGSEALGPRVGMSPAVLRNKVNPNNDTHRLAFDEAVLLSEATEDDSMLHAWAARRGYVLMRAEPTEPKAALPVQMMGLTVELGTFTHVLSTAMADGVFTPNERKEIQNEGADFLSAFHGVLGSVCVQTARAH